MSDSLRNFTCHYCQQVFGRSGNAAACVASKLRRRGHVFCSKGCGSKHHHGYKEEKRPAHFPSEYGSWHAMKTRCTNKRCKAYPRYGGRFAQPYPPEWDSFKTFLADMGPKPAPGYELERINNDLPYSKENCIWADHYTQTRNRGGKRATRLYTFGGVTLCIKDWADRCKITPASMRKRLDKGWPLERAFKEVGLTLDPAPMTPA